MRHALHTAARALACALLLAASVAHAAGGDEAERDDYWVDKNRGWFFYERKPKKPALPPPAPVRPAPAPAAAPADPATAPKHPDLVRFEALQKRVEDTRNIAIINPSEENIREYLEAQQLALDTAQRFGEAHTRVMWATPKFDPAINGTRPTSPSGAALFDAERSRRQRDNWASLSQSHAFFFFFKSDCPYCHRFAPTLRQFSEKTGIRILAISMDGGPLDEFPDFKPDNGISSRLNVTQVPALFLAEPGTGKVLPVGYGVIAPGDLERRIEQITQPDADRVAPSTVKYIGELAGR